MLYSSPRFRLAVHRCGDWDAEFANRHGFSKHRPALPLYTQRDAEEALKRFRPVAFDAAALALPAITFRFRIAGHILGAATIEFMLDGVHVVFTGDLGRPNNPVMPDPAKIAQCDFLIVESTYGNKRHDRKDPEEALAEIICTAAARGGTILVPSFAVGRTQVLLFHISQLKRAKKIPDVPVYLDSPMAIDASDIYCKHAGLIRLTVDECRLSCRAARFITTVEDSKALDSNPMPKVIISASGMATGGRVLHHLKHYASDPRNIILFTGFLAGGTRGEAMVSGAETIKIHGNYIPVRAEVRNLDTLSAHADSDEIMAWLRNFQRPPKRVFVTHGEPPAADALRHRIEEELGWECLVPEYLETHELH